MEASSLALVAAVLLLSSTLAASGNNITRRRLPSLASVFLCPFPFFPPFFIFGGRTLAFLVEF
jgi:hypothetical protein